MALLHLPLEQITEAHLVQLIEARANESRYIDYKQESYGARDQDHAEYRADISSFANTAGGDLVIGLEEANGAPIRISPVAGDIGAEKLRLESMARSGMEPPLVGVGVREVPVSGGHVIVVRTPRSYLKPHRIIYGGRNRFWARSSAGKYEPSVQELRMLFGAGGEIADRVRAFRDERLRTILSAPPIPIPTSAPLFVIHVVPLAAFDPLRAMDMRKLVGASSEFPPPGRAIPAEHTITFDGLLCLANFNPNFSVFNSYAQINRFGIVEGVTSVEHQERYLTAASIDKLSVHSAHQYMKALSGLAIEGPFAVHVAILGATGLSFQSGISGDSGQFSALPINRNPLDFAETVFDERPRSIDECASTMAKPMLQQLWNCAGFLAPPTINGGKYLWQR